MSDKEAYTHHFDEPMRTPAGIVEHWCDHPGCKRWGCLVMRRDTERCGYAAITAMTLKALWIFGTTSTSLAGWSNCSPSLHSALMPQMRGHIVMAVGKIVEGDTVLLRGEVTRVSDDGRDITVRVRGYGIPLTVNRDHVQAVEKVPVTRQRRVFDQPG